jgi:SAM-dependent methyltransferase
MIGAFMKHLRTHGVRRTLRDTLEYANDRRLDWIDASFDRRYGTDTGGIIDDMGELRVETDNRAHARGYQGIQVPVFRRIFGDMTRNVDVDPREFTFVDFGSGKGRAVMMAAERGFAAVHGVELSPKLHEVAEKNVALFRARNAAASPITLRCEDATALAIPSGPLVCFFYNPFDGHVMTRVLDNIVAAYRRAPRRLVIAYRNPESASVFDAHPFLRLASASSVYRLYATP